MRIRPLRRLLACGIGLSIYALLVVVTLELLENHSSVEPPAGSTRPPLLRGEAGQREVFLAGAVLEENLEGGVLLPVSPEDGLLPGSLDVWTELLKAKEFVGSDDPPEGFDGQQVVTTFEELAQGATAELLLSGQPIKVIRLGSTLYLLNSSRRVEIVDCTVPEQPKIIGPLAYFPVRSFTARGDVVFLLLQQAGNQTSSLVVLDSSDPLHPQEVVSHKLPVEAADIKLVGSRLAVYAKAGGRKAKRLYLYDLLDDFGLSFLQTIEGPSFEPGSLEHGKIQFVMGSHHGVQVYNLENPLAPEPVAYLNLPNRIRQLAKYGNRLFAWSDADRLYILDISNPAAPELLTVINDVSHPAYLLFVEHCTYYLDKNGYLRVFPRLPSLALEGKGNRLPLMVKGELVPLSDDKGFALIGAAKQFLPAAVKTVMSLRNSKRIVDALQWQQLFVVLNAEEQLQLFRPLNGAEPELLDTLQLDSGQRWLAAGSERVYVGGGASIQTVSLTADGHLRRSGLVKLDVASTWDGVVANEVLSVAAGKKGLLSFPLEGDDQLRIGPAWSIPKQLASHIDLRQLAVTCDGRIFAAAGDAGILIGKVDADGRFTLTGYQAFEEPARALAVIAGLCLVSTGHGVTVLDVRVSGALQKLGTIKLSGVERFVVASPDYWAGMIPGEGWVCLPGPRLVLPKEEAGSKVVSLALPVWMPGGSYQLNLFNRNGVTPIQGLLSIPHGSHVPTTGNGYVAD